MFLSAELISQLLEQANILSNKIYFINKSMTHIMKMKPKDSHRDVSSYRGF